MKRSFTSILGVLGLSLIVPLQQAAAAPARGWLNWRGPQQNGTSRETGLPDKIEASQALWSVDFPGQSSAAIANGRLYILGYLGDGPELQEVIACFDAEKGAYLWEHRFNDFLSDTIYRRYATSSPAVDPETGNIYVQGTQGLLSCFAADGKSLWQHSMMEEFGRLTFPNSRTATPIVDHDLVIVRGITSNWGAHGAAGDRFYAFDKKTGDLVWTSSPGDRPQDNTFSHPVLSWLNGKRVLFSAGGDCSLVCLNARTGEPIWRTALAKSGAKGGINAAVVLHNNDKIITVHESENLDSSEIGRMAAIKISNAMPTNSLQGPVVLPTKSVELWRNEVGSLASSPVLVGDTVYQVSGTGDLVAVDATSGKVLWKRKLGIEQRQSSPLHADGKLYVAMYISAKGEAGAQAAEGGETGTRGEFFVIKPRQDGCDILSRTEVEGKCFGSPVAYNGKVYLQTDRKLYCFGAPGPNSGLPPGEPEEKWPTPGPKKQLQIIPSEVLLKPGEAASFRLRALDGNGFTVEDVASVPPVKWASFIPPTARVRSTMNGSFNDKGELVAANDPVPSAGAFEATLGDLKGYIRGRVLPGLPIKENFEEFKLSETTTNTFEPPTPFAYPPLPWIGARFRFEVRDKAGTKALTKTIDNKLFQRGTVFIGHPGMSNYTVEADVLSDGNKRKMSEVGIVNQRYIIVLKGNSQELEVNSNQERLKVAVPFKWTADAWYHLKARVDVTRDGRGVVRAKAWKRDETEPAAWTIEVPHTHAHRNGSPGLYGFAPQEMRVYHDNISVTAN
jgi:outer membrane protein assembly factor BamB